MPALIHSLVETFSRDGVSQSLFADKEFLSWVNKQIMDKQRDLKEEPPSHLGRGVGTKVEYSGPRDQNRDPFALLVPDKGMF